MVNIDNYIKKNNLDVKILLQVHDELVFEVRENEVQKIINSFKPIMETANLPIKKLNVNLNVDYGFGKNWASAH